jgi:hypothetical protein
MQKFYVIGGGTFVDVAPHLSLCAQAFGGTARRLYRHFQEVLTRGDQEVHLVLTKMASQSRVDNSLLYSAGLSELRTNNDLQKLIDYLVTDPQTKGIVMPVAVCDFVGTIDGHKGERLSSQTEHIMTLTPTEKLVGRIRRERKDIFAVGFKATAGDSPATMYAKGLALMKRSSLNLVIANDMVSLHGMVITPEQARYHEGDDREATLRGLVEMTATRSQLHFTRSTVVEGSPVSWNSAEVPESLRAVVNHCIKRGAYKPFLGKTVGHFAACGSDNTILTSRRSTNFHELDQVGLVRIESCGDDQVVAYGSKPSVGGQSQRIIFREHPDVDCIVHFHCPTKDGSKVPVREQRPYECGSHECGQNTSDGLGEFGQVKAVMLDQHGPNVVFHHSVDPNLVIDFIERNFELSGRTDGEVNLAAVQ